MRWGTFIFHSYCTYRDVQAFSEGGGGVKWVVLNFWEGYSKIIIITFEEGEIRGFKVWGGINTLLPPPFDVYAHLQKVRHVD